MRLGSRRDPRRVQQQRQASLATDGSAPPASATRRASLGTGVATSLPAGQGPSPHVWLPVSFREHHAQNHPEHFLFCPGCFPVDLSKPPQPLPGASPSVKGCSAANVEERGDIASTSAPVNVIIELRRKVNLEASNEGTNSCVDEHGDKKGERVAREVTVPHPDSSASANSTADPPAATRKKKSGSAAGGVGADEDSDWEFHPSGGWICRAVAHREHEQTPSGAGGTVGAARNTSSGAGCGSTHRFRKYLSVHRSLTTFPLINDLTSGTAMMARVLPDFKDVQRRYGLSHVELAVQDQNLGRADMYLITAALCHEILYQGMELKVLDYRLRVTELLFPLWSNRERGLRGVASSSPVRITAGSGARVPSTASAPSPAHPSLVAVGYGVVTSHTLINFRSLSPIHYVVLELSSEMWHTTIDGRIALTWALKKFLRELFSEQLSATRGTPLLRIVYTGRLRPFVEVGSDSDTEDDDTAPLPHPFRRHKVDGKGEVLDVCHVEEISFLKKDGEYFDAADQAAVNCDAFLQQVGMELAREQRRVRNARQRRKAQKKSADPQASEEKDPGIVEEAEEESTAASRFTDSSAFTCSQESNLMECLAIILEWCSELNADIHAHTTGLAITVVSAGKGVYDVSNAVVQIVCTHLHDLGINKVNVVCMGRPPLHITPLLSYTTKDLTLLTQSHLNTDPRPPSCSQGMQSENSMGDDAAGWRHPLRMEGEETLYFESPEWMRVLFYYPRSVTNAGDTSFELLSKDDWYRRHHSRHDKDWSQSGKYSNQEQSFQENYSVQVDLRADSSTVEPPSCDSELHSPRDTAPCDLWFSGVQPLSDLATPNEKDVLLPGLGIPLCVLPSVVLPQHLEGRTAERHCHSLIEAELACDTRRGGGSDPYCTFSCAPKCPQSSIVSGRPHSRGLCKTKGAIVPYLSLHLRSANESNLSSGHCRASALERGWECLRSHHVFFRLHSSALRSSQYQNGLQILRQNAGQNHNLSCCHRYSPGDDAGSKTDSTKKDVLTNFRVATSNTLPISDGLTLPIVVNPGSRKTKESERVGCPFDGGQCVNLICAEWFGGDLTSGSARPSLNLPISSTKGSPKQSLDPFGVEDLNFPYRSTGAHSLPYTGAPLSTNEGTRALRVAHPRINRVSYGLHVLDSDISGAQIQLEMTINPFHSLSGFMRWNPKVLVDDQLWEQLLMSIIGRDGQLTALYQRQQGDESRRRMCRSLGESNKNISDEREGVAHAPSSASEPSFVSGFNPKAVFSRQQSCISPNGKTLLLGTQFNRCDFSMREELIFFLKPEMFVLQTVGGSAPEATVDGGNADTTLPKEYPFPMRRCPKSAQVFRDQSAMAGEDVTDVRGAGVRQDHFVSSQTALSGSLHSFGSTPWPSRADGVPSGATSLASVVSSSTQPIVIGNVLLGNRALFGISPIDPFTGEDEVRGYRLSVNHSLDFVSSATVFKRRWLYGHPNLPHQCDSHSQTQTRHHTDSAAAETMKPLSLIQDGYSPHLMQQATRTSRIPQYMLLRQHKAYFPHEPETPAWKSLCSVPLLPLYGLKGTFLKNCFTSRPPHQYNIGGNELETKKRLLEYVLQRLEQNYQIVLENTELAASPAGGSLITGTSWNRRDRPELTRLLDPTPHASIELTICHQDHVVKVNESAQSVYVTRHLHLGRYTETASETPILTYQYALWNFLSARRKFSLRRLEMKPLLESGRTSYWEDLDLWLHHQSNQYLRVIPSSMALRAHQVSVALLPINKDVASAVDDMVRGKTRELKGTSASAEPKPHGKDGLWDFLEHVVRTFESRMSGSSSTTSKVLLPNEKRELCHPPGRNLFAVVSPSKRVGVLSYKMESNCNVYDSKTGCCTVFQHQDSPRVSAVDVVLPRPFLSDCTTSSNSPTEPTTCSTLSLVWVFCSFKVVNTLHHWMLMGSPKLKVVPFPSLYQRRHVTGYPSMCTDLEQDSVNQHSKETLSHFVTCYYDFMLPTLTSLDEAKDFQQRLAAAITASSNESSLLYFFDAECDEQLDEQAECKKEVSGCYIHCTGLGYVMLYSTDQLREQIQQQDSMALVRAAFLQAAESAEFCSSDVDIPYMPSLPCLVIGEWRQNVPYAHGKEEQLRILNAIRREEERLLKEWKNDERKTDAV